MRYDRATNFTQDAKKYFATFLKYYSHFYLGYSKFKEYMSSSNEKFNINLDLLRCENIQKHN